MSPGRKVKVIELAVVAVFAALIFFGLLIISDKFNLGAGGMPDWLRNLLNRN